ncbi:MAG: UDP-glucose/GDP-mannose dehydrogenase family protein [Desulfobacterales bacterium]|nr:UDP-glucose/GDP-mannose dehydrogenase family protein [Desulfobacterales bacterium]
MNVCIIGTGYVGLVSAACFAEMGNTVYCIDKNPEVIDTLTKGNIHIFEPNLDQFVNRNYKENRLFFSTDLSKGLKDALFVFNCVGTPSLPDGSCDMHYVYEVAAEIGSMINEYKIIVNKSTVPVGTADQVKAIIQKELEKRNIQVEFDVVSNPEFLKEGDAVNDFMKPDRIIVGTDNVRTAKLLENLYSPFARSREKLIIMGVRSAEMTKYAANCMLATKISFINEIANICERVGADIRDVRLGIGSDTRIGHHFIYPGVGYGGSCFPKDVRALIQTAEHQGYSPLLVQAVDAVNQKQKRILADKIIDYFNDKNGIKDKILAVWGLSFKANTDDIRESSAIEMIDILTQNGMKVRAFDPVASQNAKKWFSTNPLVDIGDDQYAMLKQADALAVLVDWNQFRNPDFLRIKKYLNHPLIFDGRNLYNPSFVATQGIVYYCIGRPYIEPQK